MDLESRLDALSDEARQAKLRYERVVAVRSWLTEHRRSIPDGSPHRLRSCVLLLIWLITVAPIIILPLLQPILNGDFYCTLVKMVVCLSGVGLLIAIATPGSWRYCNNRETLWRYLSILAALTIVAPRKKLLNQWLEDVPFDGYFVNYLFAVVVALPLSMIWIVQFKSPQNEEIAKGVSTIERKISASAWRWAKGEAVAEERRRADRGLDWSFAVFASFAFNAFAVVGNLDYPPAYIVILLILIAVSLLFWFSRLDKWRQRSRSISRGGWDLGVLILVFVSASVLFALQGWVATLAGSTPLVGLIVEGFGRDISLIRDLPVGYRWQDIAIFIAQITTVVLTTSLPMLAAVLYRRSINSVYEEDGFAYALNGIPFLKINQRKSVFVPLDAKAPFFGFKANLRIVDDKGEDSVIIVKWGARGIGNHRRLRFAYAVLHTGAEFFVLSTSGGRSRTFLKTRERVFSGLKEGRADTNLYSVNCNISEQDCHQKRFQLIDYRVPPLIEP